MKKKLSIKRGAIIAANFLFVLFISSASALDWMDREWVEAGCPLSIYGVWVSDNEDNKSRKLLSISSNKITLAGNGNVQEQYTFNKKNILSENNYMEVNLNSISKDKKKNIYIKIRPHLINSKSGYKNLNPVTHNCFIKVFQFDSKNESKFDKYSTWDIYRLKNAQ